MSGVERRTSSGCHWVWHQEAEQRNTSHIDRWPIASTRQRKWGEHLLLGGGRLFRGTGRATGARLYCLSALLRAWSRFQEEGIAGGPAVVEEAGALSPTPALVLIPQQLLWVRVSRLDHSVLRKTNEGLVFSSTFNKPLTNQGSYL